MKRRTSSSFLIAVTALVAGCAAHAEARPEPAAPNLTIEDQSMDAPPPPPPGAPPADAQAQASATPPPPPAEQSPPNSAPQSPARPPAPPQNVATASAPLAAPTPLASPEAPPIVEPAPPPSAPGAPPSSAHWAYEYPSGRWVYANGYGWMWVPANVESANNEGVPYTYLYTPSYGWNWYVSPWGPGAYYYGGWVRRPYRPVGYGGGWVAHPRVVVRLGGPGPGYRHGYARGRHGR